MRNIGLVGLTLLLAGWAIYWSFSGLQISYIPPQSLIGPGEFNLWVTYFTLWLPGAILVAQAITARTDWVKTPVWAIANPRKSLVLTLISLTVYYRLGRYFFLRDLPITDEEYTNQFGGRVLASGRWAVDLNLPIEQMPTLFLINGTGGWTSFDFLGIQAVWALSELTATGPWIFSLLSAGTAIGLYRVLHLILGQNWAVIGILVFVFSPMGTLLSFTTHAHVVSRFFLVWFLYWWMRGDQGASLKHWCYAGFFWGSAMTSRPAECLLLTAPFLIYSFFELIRRQRPIFAVLAFALGVVPFGVLYFAHNWGVTGAFWLPPRMSPNDLTVPQGQISSLTALNDFDTIRRRVVENIVNNVRWTVLYWQGLLGAVLVYFGSGRTKVTFLLLAALFAHGLMGLLHDNYGVRIVGPIHFSEWVVYLSILATLGLREIAFKNLVAARVALVALCICGLQLTTVIGLSIRDSNRWHADFFEFIESNVPAGSVVLAPRNGYFWKSIPREEYNRSWVFETRSPRPDLSDEILILRYTDGAETQMKTRFPTREMYIVLPQQQEPYMMLKKVTE